MPSSKCDQPMTSTRSAKCWTIKAPIQAAKILYTSQTRVPRTWVNGSSVDPIFLHQQENQPPLFHVISHHSSPYPALDTPTCTMSNLVASPMGTAPDKPSAKSGAAQTKPCRAKASHKCSMSSADSESEAAWYSP